jgi:tripartite-type tricarboxylate transporter receptor subunit TctC
LCPAPGAQVLRDSSGCKANGEPLAMARSAPLVSRKRRAIRQIAGVFFQNITGTTFQFVPYRGGAQAVQDLVGGQVDLTITAASKARRRRNLR